MLISNHIVIRNVLINADYLCFVFAHSMRIDSMKELLGRFAEIDSNRDGLVDLEEFAEYLNLPVTSHVKHLFSLYDRVSVHTSTFFSGYVAIA